MSLDRTPEQFADRARLFPDGIEPVELYHDPDGLSAAIERCRQAGWGVVELDAAGWAVADALHDDLSQALGFPQYYGRNLDALADLTQEVGRTGAGFPPDATGGALVVRRVDQFIESDRRRAEVVVDILAAATSRALHYGWPLALLLQSDDRALRLPPMTGATIEWSATDRSSR
jgi:hypothetical protein